MSRKSTMRTSEDFVRIKRELRDEKMEEQAQDQDHLEEEDEDEGEQGQASMILGQYQHVQLPFWDKTCDIDRGESHRKRCYSRQLASEEQRIAKYVRSGRSQKLVSRNPCSKLKQENEAGKGLQVHGDLVARFIRKKERQNKVCTSKGPKDRRVRLSANTAIQFYDVQDRLGYDQSSKAIDWLIEKAKAAIEALAELPAQDYNSVDAIKCVTQPEPVMRDGSLYQLQHHQGCDSWSQKILVGSSSKYDMENPQHLNETTMNNEGIFSMVSQFQDYPTQQNSEQGLCLSLQSSESQDPYLHHSSPIDYGELALNSASSLTDLNSIDTGRFQSLMALNSSAGNEGEEFFFNSLPSLLQPPLLRENQFFSQRGPLQSNSLFSLHASTNPPIFVHGHANTESPNSLLLSSKGFSSGGFVGI